jgi:hypothetical protein
MMLIYVDPERMGGKGENDIAEHLQFTERAIVRGAYAGCEALQAATSATTVRVRDGEVLTHDGPFAETKEVLGGFYFLDCADLDEAIELASQIPPAAHGSIEIRPVAQIPGWDDAVAGMRERLARAAAT